MSLKIKRFKKIRLRNHPALPSGIHLYEMNSMSPGAIFGMKGKGAETFVKNKKGKSVKREILPSISTKVNSMRSILLLAMLKMVKHGPLIFNASKRYLIIAPQTKTWAILLDQDCVMCGDLNEFVKTVFLFKAYSKRNRVALRGLPSIDKFIEKVNTIYQMRSGGNKVEESFIDSWTTSGVVDQIERDGSSATYNYAVPADLNRRINEEIEAMDRERIRERRHRRTREI
jgi:hypothetical protein